MDHQEKKYRVTSFTKILEVLSAAGATKIREVVSTHYYGQHQGNDIEKFVEYADHYEYHVLKQENGKFTLTEHASLPDKNAGITWLKNKGYNRVNLVKMAYTEYSYKNGLVGLYVIDDSLYSVILDYPSGQHEVIEKDFGLEKAEVLTMPYDQYLAGQGSLRSIELK